MTPLLIAFFAMLVPQIPTLLLPEGNGAWTVQVTTSGGILGTGDGNFAFNFVFVEISRCITVVHAAKPVRCTRIKEDRGNQRRFSAPAVTDNANIADVLPFVKVHGITPECVL